MPSPEAAIGLLPERLDETARRVPGNLAIVGEGARLTWSQVQEESRRLARAMLARGVRRGDHLAIWMPNHPRWLLLWLAAVRIGATAVPVNTRYRADEAAYVLRQADARVLFIEDSFLGYDYTAAAGEIRSGLPELEQVVVIGAASEDGMPFDEFIAAAEQVDEHELAEAEGYVEHGDTVIIVFTSGTTGFPKGVMHDHDAVRMMQTVTAWLEIGEEDRVLGHLPLFHVAGVFSSFLLALLSGGALVQLDRWDAEQALNLIEQERISVLSGTPTHFIDLLPHADLDRFDTASLRTGWIGGSYIPPDVVRGARGTLGMEALLPVYGMTETTSCTTLGRKTDSEQSLMLGKGVPLGGYDVSVVDPSTRKALATGEKGEVAVRGYTVMKGYYKESEATAAVTDQDGWFYTGDIGVFDGDGYLRITGRLSDKLIVGGNNVHPADIERVLLDMDGVREAHVVGGSDDRLGEVPIAFVEVDDTGPGEDKILGHCRENLASFKVPRRLVFMSEWPITPTGKVQTARLRELAAEC